MARVKAFEVPGVEMYFPSGDHDPAHFHARRPGAWSAKVYIQEERKGMIRDITLWGARKIGRTDRRRIIEGVETHREALLEEQEACRAGEIERRSL